MNPQVVRSPVKAHLVDGSTVVFSDGIVMDDSLVTGAGERYDIRLNPVGTVDGIALDSVLAMESFRTDLDWGRSVSRSAAAALSVAGVAVVTALGLCLGGVDDACPEILTGSCPTVYSGGAEAEVLEAEAFSYSIAPIFESRDVDRLTAGVDQDGELLLKLRNEMLETHYINHLELIEVAHASDERVVPDPAGRPLVLAGPLPLERAEDRDGRSVAETLSGRDGLVYESSKSRIDKAIASGGVDVEDFIQLDVPIPAGATRIGLHLRVRNSLLSTVLFYDLMLGDHGARALDWLGRDLGEIAPAVELGQWVADNLGMRVSVLDGAEWREVARIPDRGPLAWDDVAVAIPVTPGASAGLVAVRLSFPADHWRIDQATFFETVRLAEGLVVPLSTVRTPDGREQPGVLSDLASADEAYLVTTPGHGFELVFRPGLGPDDGMDRERTFLLASQGYYIEWVRRKWLVDGRQTERFRPGPETLIEALRRWRASRETMEERFYSTRVPAR